MLNTQDLRAEYELGSHHLFAAVKAACSAEASLHDRVEAALRAALEFLSNDPTLARLLLIDAHKMGLTVAMLHEERLCRYADLLREARLADPNLAPTTSPSVEKEIVSAIASAISKWVRAGKAKTLPELESGLRDFTLTAYLGDSR